MKRQFAAHKSYKYARGVTNREIPAPKYVIKQCEKFIEIFDGKSDKYFLDEEKLNSIDSILKLLIMPRGLKAGSRIYDCSCGYQWLLYASALCVVYRENPNKRRYETVILEVGRKNFKTFTIATIFILLFLLEPKFSKFYSVAPDGALSREVKTAIEAMRSGQLNILNKLGCIISTKYPTANNHFEDEVNYAKRILDGTQNDETVFSLLYEPDNTEDWKYNLCY